MEVKCTGKPDIEKVREALKAFYYETQEIQDKKVAKANEYNDTGHMCE